MVRSRRFTHLPGCVALVAFLFCTIPLRAAGGPSSDAPKPGEPADPKARKTFAEAVEWQHKNAIIEAIDQYRKANKQDGGHCTECLKRAYSLALNNGLYDQAADVARDWLAISATDAEKGFNHYRLAVALQRKGIADKKDKCFSDSCEEFKASADLMPSLSLTHYMRGVSLAHLHQDDAARAEFDAFLKQDTQNPDMRQRAGRYRENIELARAKMAPPFSVTTIDGQHLSMDDLAGKVVLLDFWATWCGPCREALPHVRQIAQKFAGQPFVVLSVSLDNDESKWRDFVAKNEMTWLQYRDGGFTGPLSRQFNVQAIPATFTIDADSVLDDQHVGDANIEGKLKKLIAKAVEANSHKPAPVPSGNATGGTQ
jgi:thiol-disulfide isomerase/thioredoxin